MKPEKEVIGDETYTKYGIGSFDVENQERKLIIRTNFIDSAFRTVIKYVGKKENKEIELEHLSQNGSYVTCNFFPEEKKDELLELFFEQEKLIKKSSTIASDSYVMAAFKHLRYKLKNDEEEAKPKYLLLDNVILSENGCSIELPAKTILVGPRQTYLDSLGNKEEVSYKSIMCYDSDGKNILRIPKYMDFIREKDDCLELVNIKLSNMSNSKEFRIRAKDGKKPASCLVEIIESPDEYMMQINQKK